GVVDRALEAEGFFEGLPGTTDDPPPAVADTLDRQHRPSAHRQRLAINFDCVLVRAPPPVGDPKLELANVLSLHRESRVRHGRIDTRLVVVRFKPLTFNPTPSP